MLHFDPVTHTYSFNGQVVPSVTQVLQAEGYIDTTWFTEYGRDRGKMAHLAIHLYDMQDLDEEGLDPALAPYLEGWKKFKQESGFVLRESEVPHCHPFRQYAGTPDKIGTINGKSAVIDIKTGAVQEWTRLQLSAYVELVTVEPMARYSVQLKNDGTYRPLEYKDRADRAVWLSVLTSYQWKKANLKGR
jgi:hypothetical protein